MVLIKSRGFTLFTALVSLILIGITVLVIQHMDNSEEYYASTIINLESQSEMNSIKDFLRYEGFNIFNVLLRGKFVTYFTSDCDIEDSDDSGEITCNTESINYINWNVNEDKGLEKTKEDFVDEIFTSNGSDDPFARELAENIVFQLKNFSGDYRNIFLHRVYFPFLINSTRNNSYCANIDSTDNWNPALREFCVNSESESVSSSLTTIFENRVELIDFVGCGEPDNLGNCPIGTFYINADFTKIDDVSYFSLPRMYVQNRTTGTTIDDAILPKNNLRFFIPFRIVGAGYALEQSILGNVNIGDLEDIKWGADSCSYNSDNEITQDDVYAKIQIPCEAIGFSSNELSFLSGSQSFKIESCEVEVKNIIRLKKYNYEYTSNQPGISSRYKNGIGQVSINVQLVDTDDEYGYGQESVVYPYSMVLDVQEKEEPMNVIGCKGCTIGEGGAVTCS